MIRLKFHSTWNKTLMTSSINISNTWHPLQRQTCKHMTEIKLITVPNECNLGSAIRLAPFDNGLQDLGKITNWCKDGKRSQVIGKQQCLGWFCEDLEFFLISFIFVIQISWHASRLKIWKPWTIEVVQV